MPVADKDSGKPDQAGPFKEGPFSFIISYPNVADKVIYDAIERPIQRILVVSR